MTETTEEKDIIAAIERCIERDLGPAFDLSNGLHMSPGEAAVFHKWLNGVFDKLEDQIQDLKSQLSNREKEIEELKQNIRNFINEGEGFCPDCLDRALKDPEVDNDILRAQKSALQIHRNIKKRQDKEIEELKEQVSFLLEQTEKYKTAYSILADRSALQSKGEAQ